MGKDKNNNKGLTGKIGGRPPNVLDYDQILELAKIQCTDKEIAAVIGVDHVWFCQHKEKDPFLVKILEDGREQGRMSLRRTQYKAALGGNPAMMIWLGKQILAQKEPKTEQSIDIKAEIKKLDVIKEIEKLEREGVFNE